MSITMIHSFLEQSLQPVAIYDRNLGHFIDCNYKLFKLFGYDKKEHILSIPLVDYLHEEQFDGLNPKELIDKIMSHFNYQDVFMTSILGLRKDQSIIILEMCALRNYIGQKDHTVFFFREIDEKYLAHKAVLEKNLIYKSIIRRAFDYIDIHEVVLIDEEKYDYEGILVDRSQSMKIALGIGNEVLITPTSMARITPTAFFKENKRKFHTIINKLAQYQTVQFDWEFTRQDESIVSLNVSANLIQVKDKLILVRIMRDTSNKRAQEKLIQQQNTELTLKNQRLEEYIESNMQLENFAYVASHDIKAPLRTINSFANILFKRVKTSLSEEEQELFNFIIRGSKDLSLLVDDLLNFSRVSNQELSSDIIETDIFLNDILDHLTIPLKESNVNIHINTDIPKLFMGDRLKIMRVFQNLIQNSIKFSKMDVQPLVTIEGDEDNNYWYFSIEDNGIGIKKEFQKAIFLMFRKLNGQKYTGTGMGLALCKKIIEQHNGQIEVSSTYGKGAKFIFSISKHSF